MYGCCEVPPNCRMDSVRAVILPRTRVSNQTLRPRPGDRVPSGHRVRRFPKEPAVLDIVYVLGIIAVFVVVGLVARGVERL